MQHEPDLRYGILSRFLHWEQTTPEAVFLRQPVDDGWSTYTWREAGAAARDLLARLQASGLTPGHTVGLWSANCAQWIIADIALMMGGYVSVPLYAQACGDTLAGILGHAECRLLLIGKLDPDHLKKTRPAIPASTRILSLPGYRMAGITSVEDIAIPRPAVIHYPGPDDLLTIIYTSGTTGQPKGVMHTFGTTIRALAAAAPTMRLNEAGNRFLSYLPLSHAAERGIVAFGSMWSGGTVSFVASLDQFAATMRSVRPTHFMAVPRVWQKFQGAILDSIPEKKLHALLRLPLVRNYIARRIRSSLGLQSSRVVISGAAPITPDLLRWFDRLGIRIREGYGLSENFNVLTLNPSDDIRFGTTGVPYPGEDVRIVPETQEIIQRADWVMTGYYKNEQATAEAIRNGYLHTGDTGAFVDGHLRITGRVKDIFKTAKGEYIAPYPIESRFLALPEIDQACVLGARYPQPFLAVVLSAAGRALPRPELMDRLQRAVDAYHATCMRYQQLHKVVVVKEEWTVDNQLLTLTLKMKRHAVANRYEERLANHYDAAGTVVWE